MSENSFSDFFEKSKQEAKVPSSTEIFRELENSGVFEGTELRRRDAANLMCVAKLVEACMGLLIYDEKREPKTDESIRAYANNVDITGGLSWGPYTCSLGDIMSRAFGKYTPGQCTVRCAEDVTLSKGDSELDVIFKNLEAYLKTEAICSKTVQAYREYKRFEMIPDIKNLAMAYSVMFLDVPAYETEKIKEIKMIKVIEEKS